MKTIISTTLSVIVTVCLMFACAPFIKNTGIEMIGKFNDLADSVMVSETGDWQDITLNEDLANQTLSDLETKSNEVISGLKDVAESVTNSSELEGNELINKIGVLFEEFF